MSRPSSRGPQTRPCRRSFRPLVSRLEERTLLSVFYNLSTVASTAGGQFSSFGNMVSINDSGTVAFVGNNGVESGLWVNEPGKGLVNVNPFFTTNQSPTMPRSFLNAVAINDNGMLSATDRLSSGAGLYHTREWDEANPDAHTDIEGAPAAGGFDTSLQTFTAIDNNGDVAYVALNVQGGARDVDIAQAGALSSPFTVAAMPTSYGGAFGGPATPLPSPRPQLTDNGKVLVYNQYFTTLSLIDPFGSTQVIASPAQGFQWIGQGPGVSGDGNIVVFTGDRGNGPGLFASYASGGSSRTIIRLAGEGVDGFTDFDQLQAVRVNDTEATERGATVVFEGTSNLGTGIYTTRISFFGDSADDFDPTDPNKVTVSGAMPVALDGDIVTPASGSNPAVTISSVNLWDGINNKNRGELAFWAQLSDGSQSVIEAEPQQVVWVNFDPPVNPPSGETGTNLALLKQVGLSTMGWEGSFLDVVAGLGYEGSVGALETEIVAAVQSYYTAVSANVVVLGGPNVQAPAYVPYVTTNKQNQPVLDVYGHEVTRGVYQTVYVGAGPGNGDTDLGMASPTYTFAGGLDYFNQIPDDTAVVFADRIFDPANTGAAFAALPEAVRVEAVATVIAHEAGHNFGLFHLDPTQTRFIMAGGFTQGEFNDPRTFTIADEPVDADYAKSLAGVTESDANRLAFTVGSSKFAGSPPDPALLAISDKQAREQVGLAPTGGPVTVQDLQLAVVSGADLDLLPSFQDLGSGDLAKLLTTARLPANPQDDVIVLGSTTGSALDIVAAPDAATAASLGASLLGVADDLRLLVPLTPDAGASPWHLFQLTPSGPVDLGTLSTSTTSLTPPPVATPIADQVVTSSTSSIEFPIEVTPAPVAEGEDLFSVAPGAPAGAVVNRFDGTFVFTPEAGFPAGTYPVTIDISDQGTGPASTSVPMNTSVTFDIIMQVTTPEPPRIAPIGDRVVQQGADATFTVRATDPNGAGEALAFGLDPGAPEGATIDPATGIFSWLATSATPGNYPVTVRVTDDATPALSTTETINIQVVAASTPAPGDLVTGFGTDGVVQTTYDVSPQYSYAGAVPYAARTVLLQPNGAFIVAGTAEHSVFLARFLADGELDPTFGDRGRMSFSFPSNNPVAVTENTLVGAVLLADGKIVVLAAVESNLGYVGLARFNADGSLDTSFGTGGSVVTALGGAGTSSVPKSLALQSDGKLVVAGDVEYGESGMESAVARFLPDGTLDPSFATGGKLVFHYQGSERDKAVGVAIQADGRIDVTGTAQFPSPADADIPVGKLTVAQLEPDGSFDSSFGTNGETTLSEAGGSDEGINIAVQRDGKVLVLDSGVTATTPFYTAVLRFNRDGSLDQGFGTMGVVAVEGTGQAMAIGSSGQIVLALIVNAGQDAPGLMVALNADGSFDTAFGTGGKVPIAFDGPGDTADTGNLQALGLQSDGRVIVAGEVTTNPALLGVSRLLPDGTLDASFANAGQTFTDVSIAQQVSGPPSVAVEPDGKLLFVPHDAVDGIWQYNTDGSVNTAFGNNGVVYLPVPPSYILTGVEIEPDGKSLIFVDDLVGEFDPLVVRLRADGSLDTTFGNDGVAEVPANQNGLDAPLESFALEADGSIIVATEQYVTKLDSDGTVDASFGNGGLVEVPSQGFGSVVDVNAAVVPGGKILLALQLYDTPHFGLEFVRLDEDGTLDATFGNDGIVTTTVSVPTFLTQAVQPDGKIVVTTIPTDPVATPGFQVTRFNSDGSLDTTFGTGGSVLTRVAFGGEAEAITIAADGSILVGGDTTDANAAGEFALLRYTPAGVLDRSFGNHGIVLTNIVPNAFDADSFDEVTSIALSPDARTIYFAGEAMDTYVGFAAYYGYPPVAAPGTLQFQATSFTINPAAGTATIDVSRTGGTSGAVTVHYQTGNGTAQADSQYQPASGTLTFPAGVSSASFTVPILATGDPNSTTVSLTLSDPTGGATLGPIDTAVLNIAASGAPGSGAGVIELASATFTASEADESAIIVVDRVGGASGTVSVPYSVGGGTATSGVDYQPISDTLTFGPGVTQLAIAVPLLHDAALGGNTTVVVSLGPPGGGATLGPSQNTATLTILDRDAPSTVVPATGPTPVTANQGVARVPVTRSGGLGNAAAYDYSTVDGTAVGGADYAPTSGTLVLPEGVATGYIDIPITTDYQLQHAVSFQVDVRTPAGPAGAAINTVQTVQIQPPAPLPAPPAVPPPMPLEIISTSPAAGAVLASPPAQIVLTFNTDLAFLTDGGSAIPASDPGGVKLYVGSSGIPISTRYDKLPNGTSTITVTPNYPAGTSALGSATVYLNVNDFEDADGSRLTETNAGVLSFAVSTGSGPGSNPPSTLPFKSAPLFTVPPGGTQILPVKAQQPPSVTSVVPTLLKKGHKNQGVATITVTFSQPMSGSAGASSFYDLFTPKVVRVHHKKVTKLIPVAFTAQLLSSNQVRIQLTKPSKLALELTIRGTVTNAFGVALGADVTQRA